MMEKSTKWRGHGRRTKVREEMARSASLTGGPSGKQSGTKATVTHGSGSGSAWKFDPDAIAE
jgi:hypothetical protein